MVRKVKLDVEIVDTRLKVQAIYEAYIDFDGTFEELHKLGYGPRRCHVGRKPQPDSGNLTFTLRSGATINISPKGQPHKIQVSWNIREDADKQFCELTSLLVPSGGEQLRIIPDIYNLIHDRDTFLDYLYGDKLRKKE